MAAARRGRGASRGRQGTPAWMWLLTGILIGLGLAWYLWAKGFIPQSGAGPEEAQSAGQTPTPPTASEEVAPAVEEPGKPRYDFFTVLPEMEVVVPEQQLSEKSQPEQPQDAEPADSYLLQVGSFRQAADAEQMKASLAFVGIVARIQAVTVNGETWHRVRVGPVSGARQADELRRQLGDLGYESLVTQGQ